MQAEQQQNLDNSQFCGDSLMPRSGWMGTIDRFIGPGATQAELWIQLLPAIIAAIAAPLYALTLSHSWTMLQLGLMAFLGLDCVGGVLTNATDTAKRWYHRPGQGWQQHFTFVCVHVIHILVVAMLFRDNDWALYGDENRTLYPTLS